MNGYNFTERSRRVLQQARNETVALNHDYVGPEHILLALLQEEEGVGKGVADAILDDAGVDRHAMRATVLSVLAPGRPNPALGPDRAFTNPAKKVLELAMSQARALQHSYVGTEHLLLALIAEEKGIPARVLREAGLAWERVRADVVRLLGTALTAGPAAPVAAPPGLTERGVSYVVLVEYADGRLAAHRFSRPADAAAYLQRFAT
jgi:ATP-dependent Clp protease ATP-binding subunit ClpC